LSKGGRLLTTIMVHRRLWSTCTCICLAYNTWACSQCTLQHTVLCCLVSGHPLLAGRPVTSRLVSLQGSLLRFISTSTPGVLPARAARRARTTACKPFGSVGRACERSGCAIETWAKLKGLQRLRVLRVDMERGQQISQCVVGLICFHKLIYRSVPHQGRRPRH
jgi:hypothetical protein